MIRHHVTEAQEIRKRVAVIEEMDLVSITR